MWGSQAKPGPSVALPGPDGDRVYWLRRLRGLRAVDVLSRDLVGTAATNAALTLLGIATGVMAARLLGPGGRGELAAIQTWPSVIATVAMLGLPDALVYFCAREPNRSGTYLASAVGLAVLTSGVFVAIGYSAIPLLLAAQSRDTVTAARWYLLLVPVFAVVGMPFHALRGRGDFAAWNLLRLTPSIGWLAVLGAGWSAGRLQPATLTSAYIIVLALLFVPVAWVTSRRVPGPFCPDTACWGPMLRYGLPSTLAGMPQVLNARLDQLVVVAVLPVEQLGLYAVAVAWGSMGNSVLSSLGNVLFPRVASEPTRAAQRRSIDDGARLARVMSGATGAVTIAVTPWVLPAVFGPGFTRAVPAACVMAVAGSIAAWNGTVEDGLRGLGEPTAVMWAEALGLCATALAILVFVAPWGLLGAAIASAGGRAAVSIVLLRALRELRRESSALADGMGGSSTTLGLP